ncbi:hypothetical protein STEG23_001567, partial [Scotinomys teguina]
HQVLEDTVTEENKKVAHKKWPNQATHLQPNLVFSDFVYGELTDGIILNSIAKFSSVD